MRPPILARALTVTAAAAIATAALTGCGQDAPADASTDSEYSAGDLTLEAKPERIVSLSATGTEMLFSIGAGKQVEAVDATSNYPAQAPTTKLDAFTPNVEAIMGYEPDLIVVSHDQSNILDKLKKVKAPTYFAPQAKSIDDTYDQIADLGALTGHKKKAEQVNDEIAAGIEDAVDSIDKPEEKPSAYYELDDQRFSLNSKTFAGSLLKEAGMENIADGVDDEAGTGSPQLSAEYIVKEDPDVIFLAGGQKPDDVAGRDGWDSISAVKDDKLVSLDGDISSRWGPRVVELMDSIADAVGKA